MGHCGHALFCFTMSLLSASRLCACLGLLKQTCAIVASYQSGLSKVLLCRLDDLAQACSSACMNLDVFLGEVFTIQPKRVGTE